jgi:hypothetical protein
MSAKVRSDDLTGLIRATLWVAGLAFSTGFLSYLALAAPVLTAG